MKSLITIFLFPIFVFATTQSPEYVSHNSTEAHVDFNAFLDLKESNLNELQLKERIYTSSKYLVGPMKHGRYPAGLSGGYKVAILKVERIGTKTRVHYKITGKMVLKNGIEGEYTFYVLNEPSTAQARGKSCNRNGGTPYWYRWTPGDHCELEEETDYQVVKMPIQRIVNTVSTYPEYNKLIKNNEIRIDLFFGMATYNSFPWDPDQSYDANASQFRLVRSYLQSLGYNSEVWSEGQIEKIYRPTDGNYPHVEELTFNGETSNVRVRMFFADTGYYYNSKAFHYFLQDSVKNASILMYGGHSGLGANFNLPAIAQKTGLNMDSPKKKYQIFVIESCLPYSYYAQLLHTWKAGRADKLGTKYLDVFSTGGDVITFADIGPDMRKLLGYFHNYSSQGLKASYQEITSNIHFSRALFGVTGDEDNPTTPEK